MANTRPLFGLPLRPHRQRQRRLPGMRHAGREGIKRNGGAGMVTLYDTVEWQETPRMRWRVIGVRQYLLDNLTAICVFSVFCGTVVAAYGLLVKPSWWHDAR